MNNVAALQVSCSSATHNVTRKRATPVAGNRSASWGNVRSTSRRRNGALSASSHSSATSSNHATHRGGLRKPRARAQHLPLQRQQGGSSGHQLQLHWGTCVALGSQRLLCRGSYSSAFASSSFGAGETHCVGEADHEAEHEPKQQGEDAAAAAAAVQSIDQEEPNLGAGARVMAMVNWCMMSCSLQRVTVPVLAVPIFVSQFGYTPAMMGLLQSSVLVGYLIGQVPSGILSDLKGGDRVMLWGMILWSLSCAALPLATLAPDPMPWLLVTRFCMGLSSACLLPALSAAAARWVPLSHRTRALTNAFCGFHMGTVLGFVVTPVLAAVAGWQQVFVLYGGLGAVSGALGLRLLPSKPKRNQNEVVAAEIEATEENSSVQSTGSSADESLQEGMLDEEWSLLVAEKQKLKQERWDRAERKARAGRRWNAVVQLAVLVWAHSAIGWGFFILQSWTPTFMASVGFSAKYQGLVSGLPWMVCALMTINSGAVADKLLQQGMSRPSVRRLMQGVASIGPFLCLLPLILPGVTLTPIAKVLCITGVLVLQAFSYAGFQAYIQDIAPQDAGKIVSITNTASIAMGILGNVVTGFILEKTGDYRFIFILTAGIYLSSFFTWVAFMKGKRLRLADVM